MGAHAMPLQTGQTAIVHVVDDDPSLRGALEGLFESVGLKTQTYAAARDFLATSFADKPGCIVIDVRLPDINGLDVQAQLTEMGIRLPVVMMTGYGDIPMSVRAMKRAPWTFCPSHSAIRTCLMPCWPPSTATGGAGLPTAMLRESSSGSQRSLPRTASDAVGHGRKDEQTGRQRSWTERDHRENPPRRGHAQNGRPNAGGPRSHGRSGETGAVKYPLTPWYSFAAQRHMRKHRPRLSRVCTPPGQRTMCAKRARNSGH